jgi:hypothetical protein
MGSSPYGSFVSSNVGTVLNPLNLQQHLTANVFTYLHKEKHQHSIRQWGTFAR